MPILTLLFSCFLLFMNPGFVQSAEIVVTTPKELASALTKLTAGDTLRISTGAYPQGMQLKNLHGSRTAPILITAADPDNPPLFEGRGEGLKVSSSSYLKFSHLVFRGFSANGMNIDDGGDFARPSHHLVLDQLKILDTGPKGNHDAIKLSGVTDFIIRDIEISGWGGSGIDMVGCRNGVVEQSRFVGKEGFRQSNAIQIKGGSRSILVQNNHFTRAGTRTVQIGGSTGLPYFRPEVSDYEARDVIVAGNTFIGGEAQIAWVTTQDSHVHHNLFYRPDKWLGRILQETKDPRFKRSQRGFFERNLVVTDQRVKVFFNIGQWTAPESFVFLENLWYRIDGDNTPNLPTMEKNGTYDVDPMVLENESDTLEVNSAAAEVQRLGPGAYAPVRIDDFADVVIPQLTIPELTFSIWERVKALAE